MDWVQVAVVRLHRMHYLHHLQPWMEWPNDVKSEWLIVAEGILLCHGSCVLADGTLLTWARVDPLLNTQVIPQLN